MRVFYSKGKSVAIFFPYNEIKQALGVLRALSQFFKMKFLFDVVGDIERDLAQPKLLPYFPTFHLCEACSCEIDIRKNNHTHLKNSWVHIKCPVLEPNRPN